MVGNLTDLNQESSTGYMYSDDVASCPADTNQWEINSENEDVFITCDGRSTGKFLNGQRSV